MIWLALILILIASSLLGAWCFRRASLGQPSDLERFDAEVENLKREIGIALKPVLDRACARLAEWLP